VGTNVEPVPVTDPRPLLNRQATAEAAVWIARLHGPDRSSDMEREFRAWLAASMAHRQAFERCTEVWQDVPRVTVADAFGAAKVERPTAWRWGAAALAGVVLAGVVVWPTDDSYVTGVGEHRQVVLADGSRLRLNTATTLRVRLGQDRREVELETGEALFEVAKDPNRPFVVKAGDHEVRALGTVFAVRKLSSSPDALSVTLIEGKVAVATEQSMRSSTVPLVFEAGQRLKLARAAAPQLDSPPMDRATAWTRGEVALDDVSLPEAVAEMNRYSRRPIVLLDALKSDELRVSGVYRAGDSEGFAGAVAALHGLQVRPEGERLVLLPVPAGQSSREGPPPARQ
jgi:transmembrane sensor